MTLKKSNSSLEAELALYRLMVKKAEPLIRELAMLNSELAEDEQLDRACITWLSYCEVAEMIDRWSE